MSRRHPHAPRFQIDQTLRFRPARRRISARAIAAAAVAAAPLGLAAIVAPALAADIEWTGAPGTPLPYTSPTNWAGNVVPGAGDNALINNGGVATLSSNADVSTLRLGATAGTSGTMQQSGGTYNAGDQIRVGDAGTGTYILSGGTVSNFNEFMIGAGSGGTGTLRISGGTINSQFHFIPGAGTNSVGNVVQTGGQIDALFPAVVATANGPGSTSIWDMSAGTINTGEFYVGANGNGTFNLSGTGSIHFTVNMHVGAGPTGIGTFNMSGGTLNGDIHLLVAEVGKGTANISGGVINVARFNTGQNTAALGVVNQTGGTVNISAAQVIGEVSTQHNLYDLSGGTLRLADPTNQPSARVGSSAGTGELSIRGTGEMLVDSHLLIAVGTASIGTFTMSGGTLTTGLNSAAGSFGGFIVAGENGAARMNISGGVINTDIVQMGRSAASPNSLGIGTMTGGTLNVDQFMAVGQNSPNANAFTITGGNLIVAPGGTFTVATEATDVTGVGTVLSNATLTVGGTANVSIGGTLSNGTGGATTGGNGTIIVNGGNLTASAFNNRTNYTQSGGTASFGVVNSVGSMNISGGTLRVPANGTAAATSRVTSLSLSGTGRFDLTNNALVIDYTGPTPIADVRTQIASAFAGGAWSGPGLTSSSANNATHGLGYAEASALTTVDPIFGTVDADAVLVRYTRYGDANLDAQVNLADFNRLAANFGATNAFWHQGDFNYDGNVNLQDFNRLAANFGLSAAGPTVTPDDWARLGAAVPEPSSLALLGFGALAIARRRRGSRH